MKFSFVATFKNRDQKRIRLFLDSLQQQTNNDFELIFINQGSDADVNEWIEKIVLEYSFVDYYYNCTEGFLWNKGNALNVGIKAARGEYIIVADVDLIFLPGYLESINNLLKPGLFITHNALYIPESFIINAIADVTNQEHNAQFEEAFHSACVAEKQALININGYDEFYLVWGVEDDDIIRRLRQSGQKQKHISSNDLNIFHQWHPSVSFARPSAWYLLMVNHLFSINQMTTFNSNWGISYKIADRPVLNRMVSQRYKNSTRLGFNEGHRLFFFNSLMKQFHELPTGETAYLSYAHIKPAVQATTSFSLFKRKKTKAVAAEEITINEVSQFFQFFIGCNRPLMQDYYYKESGNEFLFVCIKR
ncbi:MAG: glycosyltransferase [Ferruginibacter sp.]